VTEEPGRGDWTSERFDFGMSVVGREELLTRSESRRIEHTKNSPTRRLANNAQVQWRSSGPQIKLSAHATGSASCGL
jgi:hypothetical protein